MSGTKTIDKVLTVLKYLLVNGQGQDIDTLSRELDIPQATLYRHIAALEKQGLLKRQGKYDYLPGLFLVNRFEHDQFRQRLREAALPHIEELSGKLQLTAHLGVFEEDMVTYVVKCGPENSEFFTREDTQLDAYCSGLGKILLGALPPGQLDAYFNGDELPPLTEKTITDKQTLLKEIQRSRKRGYTLDDEEFEENLFCIAAPVLDNDGNIIAALSISSHSPDHLSRYKSKRIKALRKTCTDITEALYS